MRRVCCDMVSRLPELAHIEMARVAISVSQTRKPVSHGLQAALTPLRFYRGASSIRRRGSRISCQRIVDHTGNEVLYILSFYLPRFLNHPLEEKLATIIHELWHISPRFDGDLRRHQGRCYAHGSSQERYDREMECLAQRWLALDPPLVVYEFLEWEFDELVKQHGAVYGHKISVPRLYVEADAPPVGIAGAG